MTHITPSIPECYQSLTKDQLVRKINKTDELHSIISTYIHSHFTKPERKPLLQKRLEFIDSILTDSSSHNPANQISLKDHK